jgi:serpin B
LPFAVCVVVAVACRNRPADPSTRTEDAPAPPVAGEDESVPVPPPAEVVPLSAEEAALVDAAVRGLAADLFARLGAEPGNLAFSPVSIAVALGMTSAGARGETAAEMNRVLRLGDDPDRTRELLGRLQRLLPRGGGDAPVEIAVANRLFGERTYAFRREFLDLVAAQFAAPLEQLDFRGAHEAARARINGWVSERTRERIPTILPEGSVDPDTRLALVNAIYFLGKWAIPFPRSATADRPFTLADGSEVQTPTMAVTGAFGLGRAGDAEVVSLPYADDELSMVLVLPPAGTAPHAWATAENLAAIPAPPPRQVRVVLPRFEIDPPAPRRLEGDLVALGMRRAFDPESAEFEGIADPPDPRDRLVVSAVFHKAFVKVDEEGTEASAATAVLMVPQGAPPAAPPVFQVDRPFLFLLRENATGLVLFAGRVDDPRGR